MNNNKILKWSGSKHYLANYVDAFVQSEIAKGNLDKKFSYFEPFFGSGAIFFHLNKTYNIKKAYLNDSLPELIKFYSFLTESDIEKYYKELTNKAKVYNNKKNYDSKTELFLIWRKQFNELINPIKIENLTKQELEELSLLFILLNQSCFNGVYRKNPKGEFNVPHGRTTKKGIDKFNSITIPDLENFLNIKNSLGNAQLTAEDFRDVISNAKKGDLVYFDPPYFDTVNYYGKQSFTKSDHYDLNEIVHELIRKEVNVMVSNSDSTKSKRLFTSPYTNVQSIAVTRTIQRKSSNTKNYKNDKTELFITSNNPIRVVELFAGVGGFRLGLESNSNTKYKVIWSNQWEPQTKVQHASLVYENKFKTTKDEHSDKDIFTVKTSEIPNHDLLVGGFPCQDYSVATTLKNSKGLIGKKGVLWWAIERILSEKGRNKPKYLLLENVDRLLKSPASQRGRDFAVMLKSLDDLGYAVEWRVINSADYGMPQKRHRVYFLGYHQSSNLYKKLQASKREDWVLKNGVLAKAFKIKKTSDEKIFELTGTLENISKNFNKYEKATPFNNAGLMINGTVTTFKSESVYSGKHKVLKDIVLTKNIDETFYINQDTIKDWKYQKGAKKILRKDSKGFEYTYSEGSMSFPDSLNKPSRTIITGEGGATPSRFKHVIKQNNKYRRLTPIELERLNMFPDNHTQLEGISDTKRAFFMGNALVVGVVKKIGVELFKQI